MMELTKTNKPNYVLLGLAGLMIVCTVISSIFFENFNESWIAIGIIFMAIAISSSKRKENVALKIKPETQKKLIIGAIFLIISGIITALMVV